MKQITVATMTTKEGTNDHGPWVNHRIKDTDGNDWTTFADEDKTITQGSVLEVERKMKDGVPELKDNRMRFDKFTIVTAGAPAPAPGYGPPANGDDPAKRLSIERQSSAASLLQYGASMYGNNMTGDETTAVNKAIAWLSSRFDDVPASEPTDDIVRTDRINAVADRAAEGGASPTEIEDARTQADKDWAALESAGSTNGLDVDWAIVAVGKLGWSGVTTLHSWLKSQGIAPVAGETIEEIFANIPKEKTDLVRSAIETRLKEKGG